MAAEITPSKQVRLPLASLTCFQEVHITNGYAQAAASLESLKVKDSPVKKLNFDTEDKENMPVTLESTEPVAKHDLKMEKMPVTEVKETTEQPQVPKTWRELEKEEPLLQENGHRFVLFPLKYHEIVRVMFPQPAHLSLYLTD
jgi:hypothetical protein